MRGATVLSLEGLETNHLNLSTVYYGFTYRLMRDVFWNILRRMQ